VRNACTDYLRREKMANSMEQKASRKFFPASPEEIYTLNELQQKINEAMEKLPQNSRQAFELNRFQDMTYAQIADEMHI
ncbi:sigma-70 family RNA polymerase sigma factor, partial [Streptococcus pyogenes]